MRNSLRSLRALDLPPLEISAFEIGRYMDINYYLTTGLIEAVLLSLKKYGINI